MGTNNKKEYIKQLFLYYKPTLSRGKQIDLLRDWVDTCVNSEEYEMASTLNTELQLILDGKDTQPQESVKLTKLSKLTENNKKTQKKWVFINKWDELHGFTVINLDFSVKKGLFEFMFLNYGVKYG